MNRRSLVGLVGLVGLLAACSGGLSVVGGPADSGASDLGPLDVGFTVDVPDVPAVADAGFDVPIDVPGDVPFRCSDNASCTGNAGGPACDTSSGRCVQCIASADTCPAGQYCVAATNACAPGCRDDASCRTPGDGGVASATARCDTATHVCVACLASDDCPLGNLCVGNLCVTGCTAMRACPSGQTCCGGACVDPQSNVAHCGACDARCTIASGTSLCMNGTCAVGTCTAPNANCDGNAANGCETNTQTDVAHCGGCMMACAARDNATARCAAGSCAYDCATGFADCDMDPSNGCEVDTRTSTANCGRCGGACALANATSTCTAGACAVASCNTGFGNCDGNAANGCEANTQTDVANCGACMAACPSRANGAPVCVSGACGVTCLASFADCDGDPTNGCESNSPTDLRNCGTCGRSCDGTNGVAACRAGTCALDSCNAGFANCDNNIANGCEVTLATSSAHCGMCGRACLAGAPCTAGVCVLGPNGSGGDGPFAPPTGTVTINTVRSPAAGVMGTTAVDLSNPTGFAAGQMVFLHQTQGAGAGTWEIRQIILLTGSRITVEAPLVGTYNSTGTNRAQAVVIPQYTTVSLTGATVVAPPWDGNTGGVLALVARDSVRIQSGGLVMSERGFRGHPLVSSFYRPGEQGEGHLGYGVQDLAPNGNGGGGGGRTNCDCCWAGAGGGGGHATSGTNGNPGGAACQPGGNPGLAVGNAAQTTIFFGGAGANGGAEEDGHGSPGAHGGGIIYVASAAISVESPGFIRTNGQVGQYEVNITGCGSGGGGGGAGGAVYLRTAAAALGAGLITANGGLGGDNPANCGTPGGLGSAGRITLRGSSTTTGTTTPTFTAVP